jgi:hypothetical protein
MHEAGKPYLNKRVSLWYGNGSLHEMLGKDPSLKVLVHGSLSREGERHPDVERLS